MPAFEGISDSGRDPGGDGTGAQRQGYQAGQDPRRDPKSIGYGGYRITDTETGDVVASFGRADRLAEVEPWLRREER